MNGKYEKPSSQRRVTSVKNLAGNITHTAYDANGNLLGDGNRKFFWDAKNRLTKIRYPDGSGSTEFTYDGLGRRAKIIEKNSAGTMQSETRYLWVNGNQPAEERDMNNNVIKRYYGQGEQILNATSSNDKLYYTTDHLGSIRELINANTQIQARYDYDPYGRRTKLNGSLDTTVAYTGHHQHTKSNLYLTWYRQYDPKLGRWLSRDLNEEQGGINLYSYTKNNYIKMTDPRGLKSKRCGYLVVRALEQADNWWAELTTGIFSPHMYIVTADGISLDHYGSGEGERHWTARRWGIQIPKCCDCKKFTQCLKDEYAALNTQNTTWGLTNNCQTDARQAIGKCREKICNKL
jgi:RHS repeat-associated protein